MDVATAFPNPEVDDPDLYVTIPEGWDSSSSGNDGTGGSGNSLEVPAGSIIRLRRALYGQKQGPWLRKGTTRKLLL